MSQRERRMAVDPRQKPATIPSELLGDQSLFELTTCRGRKANCPNVLVEVEALGEILREKLNELEQAGLLGERAGIPVLSHHKFKVTVAGCPNACSQPQIKDFAIIGLVAPKRGQGSCVQCGACVEACLESAISLDERGPIVDVGACLACGACIRACKEQALVGSEPALRVIVAGRLGRHPVLARDLGLVNDLAAVAKVLDICIRCYNDHKKPGERFTQFVDRFGLKKLQNLCVATGLQGEK